MISTFVYYSLFQKISYVYFVDCREHGRNSSDCSICFLLFTQTSCSTTTNVRTSGTVNFRNILEYIMGFASPTLTCPYKKRAYSNQGIYSNGFSGWGYMINFDIQTNIIISLHYPITDFFGSLESHLHQKKHLHHLKFPRVAISPPAKEMPSIDCLFVVSTFVSIVSSVSNN